MAKSTAKGRVETVSEEIAWLEAEKGYALGVENGKLICRNAAGKRLASVPKELKDSELAEQLRALCEWLEDHQTQCLRRIETWMLRSLPVPCEVLRSVWPDTAWRDVLMNLVVVPLDAKGKAKADQSGLLRDVDATRGLGVVDRDGETQWVVAEQILIPHPILIDGLNDLRELVTDLGFTQAIEQLYRPTFEATAEQRKLDRITDYSDGRFEMLAYATSHSAKLGYPVRGGYACSRVWENGVPVEARYWVGDDAPESEALTGDLIFVDSAQKPIAIAQVGRVTFSEGVRMASQIYARRKVEKTEGETS